jgi:short-subunit dehydrogenase
MELRGKVTIVTGASSGIGLATARALVQAGGSVALVARTAAKLEQIAGELGERAAAFPLDVGDLGPLAALPARVKERFGRLDAVVNNAGLHHRGDMLRHGPEKLAAMCTVNLAAPMVLTRAAADLMGPGGCVVNVASLAGKLGVPGSAVYSGTKAGLRFWALAAAEDLERRGLRIANVNPGPVDTGFFDEDIHHVSDLTFSQPMVSAEQVADAVLACLRSDESPMEIDLPAASGKLATLGYLAPGVGRLLRPLLELRGARAKRAFMARKGLRLARSRGRRAPSCDTLGAPPCFPRNSWARSRRSRRFPPVPSMNGRCWRGGEGRATAPRPRSSCPGTSRGRRTSWARRCWGWRGPTRGSTS